MPVTGMSEDSMLMACSLGKRFAFVTFTPSLGTWYSEQVRVAGLDSRFAGVHAPDGGFSDIKTVVGDLKARLTEVCRTAARTADVVILAGAPIAGLACQISRRCRGGSARSCSGRCPERCGPAQARARRRKSGALRQTLSEAFDRPAGRAVSIDLPRQRVALVPSNVSGRMPTSRSGIPERADHSRVPRMTEPFGRRLPSSFTARLIGSGSSQPRCL